MRYDTIVIGAGAAEAVLAARPSEDARRSVLLLEAGPDYATVEQLPEDLRHGHSSGLAVAGPHMWGYVATANAQQATPIPIPRGKVTGGSSTVMGTILLRGLTVVDQYCRVHGLEGLRVVDASVMPDVIRANTNATTIMQEVKDVLRHYYIRYSGPGGLTEQDDMENWNYASAASKGTIARRYPYNYQMGLGYEGTHPAVPGVVTVGISEQNQRGFYKRWAEFMAAQSWADLAPAGVGTTGSRGV